MSAGAPVVSAPVAEAETASEGDSPATAVAVAAKPNYKLHVAEEAICESCQ